MTSAELVCMTAAEARVITDRIKVGVEAVWDLIKQAYVERAWDALGYASWDDYTTREFGTARLRLPREERAEVVASLRDAGLSIRAIASATQTSVNTVQKDLAQVYHFDTPATEPESPAPTVEPEPDTAERNTTLIDTDTGEVLGTCIHCARNMPVTELYEGGQGYECDPCIQPDEPVEPAPAPTVTGLDGKTYPSKPTPKEPRRKPLLDTARDLSLDLSKITGRIERFTADDRLGRNANEVAAQLRHYLIRAIEVCQDLDNALKSQGV